MPSEAEVFIDHLNAGRQVKAAAFATSSGAEPDRVHYLKERVAAVRQENRDLREELEKVCRENQRFRQDLAGVSNANQELRAELERARQRARAYEEESQVRGRHLQDIWASWNWRLANRLQRARLAVTRCLHPNRHSVGTAR
jgi:chromosome segregation ATPase